MRRFATCDTAGLLERADKEEVKVCGMVAALKELTTKKGDRMAFVTLEDLCGSVEMVVFPEVYQAAMELLKSEEPLLVTGTLDVGEETVKLMPSAIAALGEATERMTRRVHFRLTATGLDEGQLRSLKSLLERHRGGCEPLLHLVIPGRCETILGLPEALKVAASDPLMADAERLFGRGVVTFE
jgi:DNA polymerase-3 subunit alpha